MRVRVVARDDPAVSQTYSGYVDQAQRPRADRHRPGGRRGGAAAVRRDGRRTRRKRPPVAVCPEHLAVLVRTNRQAGMVREALEQVGVPAVINGAGSVFATDPARHWLRLLEALERPASMTRARSAALTPFIGWSAERLARGDGDGDHEGGSDEWEEVHRRLHDWARVLRLRGVASLQETITATEQLPAPNARPRERRARADRPAPHRSTPARRVGRGAARRDRADRVAREPDRRGRDRHRRRGAQQAARVRRPGRAGVDDPSQQGAGVPNRLRAVSLGARLDPRQPATAGLLP